MKLATILTTVTVLLSPVSAIAGQHESSGHLRPDRPETHKPHRPEGGYHKPEKPSYHKPPVAHKPFRPEGKPSHKPVDKPEQHKPSKPEGHKPSRPTAVKPPHKPVINQPISNTATANAAQQQDLTNQININDTSINIEAPDTAYSNLGDAGSIPVPVFNVNGGVNNSGYDSGTGWFVGAQISVPIVGGGDRQAVNLRKCLKLLKDGREVDLDLDTSQIKVCKGLKTLKTRSTATSSATPENNSTPETVSSSDSKETAKEEQKNRAVPALW